MEDNTQDPGTGFYGLAIAPKLLSALDQMKFKTPTPIQRQAIPVACSGKDVAGIAQTGTGKTIAFGIPLIQALAAKPGKGLVLVPTRELALQVEEVLRKFAPLMGLQTVALIGGDSMGRQLRDLRRGPRIIIATPGRLIDHLAQRSLRLDDVRVLVLDEADRMLDMGFAPQIDRILRSVPKERQTMLFSATLPDEIMKIAGAYMKLPVRVEVARSGTLAAKVAQEVFVVQKASKNLLLQKLLEQYGGSVLLFSRTKHNAKKIARDLRGMGHSAAEIHSNRSLNQRREALEGFKSGKYRVLVATDIAARGIDVMGIELVINYDLPDDYDNYVHRIGRTGRAGHDGRAISFATPEQGGDVRGIERLIQSSLPIVKHPDFPEERLSGGPSPRPQMRRNKPQHYGAGERHERRPQQGGGQHEQRRDSGFSGQATRRAAGFGGPQPGMRQGGQKRPDRFHGSPQRPHSQEHGSVSQPGRQEHAPQAAPRPHESAPRAQAQQPRREFQGSQRREEYGRRPQQGGPQGRPHQRSGGAPQRPQGHGDTRNGPRHGGSTGFHSRDGRPQQGGGRSRSGGQFHGNPRHGQSRDNRSQGPTYGNFGGRAISNYSGYVPLDLGDRKPPRSDSGGPDRNKNHNKRR